ncbi:unnamed protein product [Strongylus vulgaris]|uniref:Uncharacterized protein n=1 Tax=Strongylus vulgaris TaxID=40348 RepID=A0A3P7JWY1_STRVU|nr:unnamed protein product [Strongylus vulgaris]
MGRDETLCMIVDDGGKNGDEAHQNAEWFNAIMSALIPSRALQLERPLQPLDFFECVWDVDVVSVPKLKRPPRLRTHSRTSVFVFHKFLNRSVCVSMLTPSYFVNAVWNQL